MIVVAIASQKGGAGKSTIARLLAVRALAAGIPSAILDTDPQGTVADWGAQRRAGGIKAPFVAGLDGRRIDAAVADIRDRGAALLVIDTPPHARETIGIAIGLADAVLVPVQPSADDLRAVGRTIAIIDGMPARPAGIVVNMMRTGTAGTAAAASALATFGRPVLTGIRFAIAHQYAAASGRTAAEAAAKGAPAEDADALWRFVVSLLPRLDPPPQPDPRPQPER